MYAVRGARVCVVGRRQKEIEEVEQECKLIQRMKESEQHRNTFGFCGDFASPEQMIMLRDVIQAGESHPYACLSHCQGLLMFMYRMARFGYGYYHGGRNLPAASALSREFEARQ